MSKVFMNFMNDHPKLGVLYHSPADQTQDFAKTIYWKNPRVHPPINWHSFPAATGGKFFNITDQKTFGELHEKPPKISCYKKDKMYLAYMFKARQQFLKFFTFECFQEELKSSLKHK